VIEERPAAAAEPGGPALEADLRTMVPQGRFRLDVPGWFGT
jgi:hypothetical protein